MLFSLKKEGIVIKKPSYTEFVGIKSIFYFCSLPLRLDSYKGCSFGCLYCFSHNLNNRRSDFRNSILPAPKNGLEKLFRSISSNQNGHGPVRSALKHKLPIHFGSVSDPFQYAERTYKTSLSFMDTLIKYNYPTVFSTKSDLIVEDAYIKRVVNLDCMVQVSFSTLNENLASILEPYAASVKARMSTLERLASKGVYTVVRMQPFLYPVEQIQESIFKDFSEIGVKHIILEHLRIPTNTPKSRKDKLWNAMGINVESYYRSSKHHFSRINLELDTSVKLKNYILAKSFAHKYGLTIGSGDNDLHSQSDSICCCGEPPYLSFENIYKGHMGCIDANISREENIKYIKDQWHPTGSIREYINSHCRNHGPNNMCDLVVGRYIEEVNNEE